MNPKQPLGLAIEVIGRDGSVALMRGGVVVAARHLDTQARAASTLIPAIKEVLAQDQSTNQDQTNQDQSTSSVPNYVSVAIGPGSFTGLRIAVTAAKTLAFAWEVPLVVVDSLAAIAESAVFVRAGSADCMEPAGPARILVGLTAYRGQIFRGRYEVGQTRTQLPELREIEPVELLCTPDWKSTLEATMSHPDSASSWIFAGDQVAFERFGAVLAREDSDPINSRAAGVGRIAAKIFMNGSSPCGKIVAPLDAVPDYFRPSAAEEKSSAR